MPRFRSRETFEAEQWFPWSPVAGVEYPLPREPQVPPDCGWIKIPHTRGGHVVHPGDWIFKRDGKLVICKDWMFRKVYEEIS